MGREFPAKTDKKSTDQKPNQPSLIYNKRGDYIRINHIKSGGIPKSILHRNKPLAALEMVKVHSLLCFSQPQALDRNMQVDQRIAVCQVHFPQIFDL